MRLIGINPLTELVLIYLFSFGFINFKYMQIKWTLESV